MRPPVILGAALFLFMASAAYPSEKDGLVFRKQPELQQIKPKKPVKIRLKRTSKDDYTWELTGDEVEEIIKTDKRLRKMLNIK